MVTTFRHWSSRGGAEIINKREKLLKLRSQNGIELHVKEGRNRGKQIKIGDNEYELSDHDTQKRDN